MLDELQEKEYEVQVHFENGGNYMCLKKLNTPYEWLMNFHLEPSQIITSSDGRSIFLNMSKVLAVVVLDHAQKEVTHAVDQVQE